MDLASFFPKGILDPYDRPARLYPGLLVLLPLAILLICLFGPAHPWVSGTLSAVGFCGGGYLLGRASRDAGKRLQDTLFAKWGGAPTTQLLRYRNNVFDAHTKDRFHKVLSRGLGTPLPTRELELADPGAADELYRAATNWLIGQTRDAKRFPLVFKENVAFGFQRNSLGLRRYGVAITLACIFWVLLHASVLDTVTPLLHVKRLMNIAPAESVCLLSSAFLLFVWVAFLNEGALRRTGFAYAERLLQSCDQLPAKKKGKNG